MPLEWSEPKPPTKDVCSYDHIIAATPLGEIRIEWKSWKSYDSPSCEMPWGEYVTGACLSEAKLEAQAAWDRMIPKLLPLCTR